MSHPTNAGRWTSRVGGIADLLGFAASPAFALMAWASSRNAPPDFCSSTPTFLPIDGMAWMYLLMCLFHLSPWLRLVADGAGPEARIAAPIERK